MMFGFSIEWVVIVAIMTAVTIFGALGLKARLRSSRSGVADQPSSKIESIDLSTSDEAVDGSGRFFLGLARSRDALSRGLRGFFSGQSLDEAGFTALENTLISSDVGVHTAMALCDVVRQQATQEMGEDALRGILVDEMKRRVGQKHGLNESSSTPLVILVVGVNGSGKTTTIGKLAARFKSQGRSVLLAAGDTFRAGAIEQLKVWGERADVAVVAQQDGSDPAAVIFDALDSAKAKGSDVVICDTAGRLQAHGPLMEELSKVNRIIGKSVEGAPHEVLLVLDATIGQNALSQAKAFKAAVGVTGVVLTKLDGTAKGGVVLAVQQEIGVPVKLVGLGEGIDDLQDFDPSAFVDALVPRPV